ncbi:MAG: nuclease [Sphingobium sp.]|nr:nuclease [Sphingobium sp.]
MRRLRTTGVIGIVWLFAVPEAALADSCTAPLPSRGSQFSGVVRYIGDGDSLCVGPAARPNQWIEVRLVDFNAPELHEQGGQAAKQRLRFITLGHRLMCRAGQRSYDRVVAACTLDRRALGDVLRQAGGVEGGR